MTSFNPSIRFNLTCVTLAAMGFLGCGPSEPGPTPSANQTQPPQTDNQAGTRQSSEKQSTTPESRPAIKTTRLTSGGPSRQTNRDAQSLGEEAAVASITTVLSEYAQSEPTLVIWLMDSSTESSPLASSIAGELRRWYDDSEQVPENLETVIARFATDVEYLVETPSQDTSEISEALAKARGNGTEPGESMRALQQVLERYRRVRETEGKLVLVGLVTAGNGGDWEQAGEVAALSRELTIPIFSIGYAAPFGRSQIGNRELDFGPETPAAEFIQFSIPGGGNILLDSGFGPWGLEFVSRSAGGTFLAIRPKANRMMGGGGIFNESWPSDEAARFNPANMAKYTPLYVPLDQYQQQIESNAALSALVQVADRYAMIPILQSPSVQFSADDEAAMKRELDAAQQPAALLSPTVNQVYELLKEGEGDRSKITNPRWQAAYDLALGQALAHVVRVDGYNGMLAQLKTGKNFQNKDSDVWVLEAGDTIDTSSLMRSKLEQAQELLQGVIDNHPGTPWAYIAEQELKTPIGYEWKEIDLDR